VTPAPRDSSSSVTHAASRCAAQAHRWSTAFATARYAAAATLLVAGLALQVAVAADAPSAPVARAGAGAGAGASAVRPAGAQTLRVGVNSFPASLGNPFRGNGRPGTLVWYALFDGLTQLDENGRLVPALAIAWEATGPTTWRFRLRENVRYANGRPFDAAAAAAVLGWLASADGRRTVIGNELRVVKSARAIDARTLELVTSRPDPILPNRLVGALMVEPDAWARLGPDGFAREPVGTGPFVLERWDQRTRRIHVRANPHTWRPANFGRIVFVELPDAAVRTQALLSRDVDIAPVEIEELDRLRDRGFPVFTAPSMSVMSIAFITERERPSPLQDVRVRRALNHAVDKEAIARVLLRGLGRASGQPAPRVAFGHDPALAPYRYDPALARRLLAEAGYPNGFTLTAEIQINAIPADSLIYQSVAHYLRQVGVELTLRVIPFPQYLKKLATNGWTVEAFGATWNSAPYNDAMRPMETFSCRRPRPFFCDEPLAEALGAASRIADPERRLAAMRGVARGYHDAAPALFLVEQIDLYSHRPDLEGVQLRNRVPVYHRLSLASPTARRAPPEDPS